MQKAAQQIMDALWWSVSQILMTILPELKGIGPYTAGAISSTAFGLPEPACMMVMLCELWLASLRFHCDIGDAKNRKIFQAIMDILMDPDRPGDFNQALLEPWDRYRISWNSRDQTKVQFAFSVQPTSTELYDEFPIKLPKKKPKPMQIQAFIIRNAKGEFLLEKNIEGRLLGSFWSFPIMETDFIGQQLSLFEKDDSILETVSQKAIFEENYALKPEWTNNDFTPVKHTFSHQKWTIEMVEGSVNDDKLTTDKELCWVAAEDFDQFPMATPQKKMIKTYKDSKKG